MGVENRQYQPGTRENRRAGPLRSKFYATTNDAVISNLSPAELPGNHRGYPDFALAPFTGSYMPGRQPSRVSSGVNSGLYEAAGEAFDKLPNRQEYSPNN